MKKSTVLRVARQSTDVIDGTGWTETHHSKDLGIHQLFEAQVERSPDTVAVVFEDQQLTYQELNCRANQLAHHLQVLGIRPEVCVGLCIERSLDTAIGILGILKAGGAYVPLDPAYPQERLAYMLADSQVPVLVTVGDVASSFAAYTGTVVCLDRDLPQISQHSQTNPVSTVTLDNLIYIIYTSGSTGKPKGVQLTHGNVGRLFAATQEWYQFDDSDVWTMFHSYAFDFSVWELWGALIYGGRLVIVPFEVSRSPQEFYELLAREQVTVLNQTPAAFRQLMRVATEEGSQLALSLRWVIFGGEALELHSLKPWFDKYGDTVPQLVNMYGITETTVHVTYRPIDSTDLDRGSVIGCPIPDLELYILNPDLQPVAIRESGEMYVGGAGVARGYLNRPELTAERFISHPFQGENSSRLYKTGDLARYLPNGDIEYLGRIDNQVKIRGFRIELGEIEALLSQHPSVHENVVIAREDEPGNQRLVAYIVSYREPTPATSELRQFLKKQLPDYMLPSAFVMLEAIPLTPNGKVDRRALPAPDLTTRGAENTFVAPRTPTEEILLGIWADILGVEVGVYDNFFELGGHSLNATQVISRVRNALCVELPLRLLFEFPTLGAFSEHLEATRNQNQNQYLPPIQPIARDSAIPLSFAQQRLWFLDQLEGESAPYNIPIALRLSGVLNVTALEQAIVEIVRRHEALRTTFSNVNGSVVQVIASNIGVTLSAIGLQELPKVEQSAEVQRLANEEAQRSFDLSRGPLLYVTLLRLEPEENVLLVTMHHIVTDGWSMGIFIEELSSLYEAFSQGKTSPLSELPIQYADFAHWQRQWLQGEMLETQLNYWKQHLSGSSPVLDLPIDRPRPAVQTFQGRTQSFQLNLDLTQRLKTLSQQSGTTLFMTLLAAFVTLLSRYSRQEDMIVGSPIANRNRREIDSLMGFFVNTIVLRTDVSGNPSFSDLLSRVRQIALDAYTYQDVPFEQVVEALQPERNLSYNPLFQVMFVWQNAPSKQLQLPGLTLTPLAIERDTAQFDLTLTMEETQQGLAGEWEYNTDLFDAATIIRMMGHFQTLLAAIVDRPQQRVSELPLLTANEQHQLLVEWNNTSTKYPDDKCIHQLFEAQVERSPDTVAVVFEDQQLTYQELNCRANQLAHHLQVLGIRPEVCVGLCIERSLEMVVGILAILKAGGAYVPLDPAYPQERLADMLSDSQVSVLLTQEQLLTRLPQQQAHVVCIDTDWGRISQESQKNPLSNVLPENLAYVIYTSGSTGKPKGVMIQHQSLMSFTQTATVEYELSERDRVLQFASISFDAAAEEIYPCITCGGTLVLRTDEMLSDLQTFIQKCRDWKLTILDLPTAYWHQVTSELAMTDFVLPESLRLVIIGGERALPELVQTWQKVVGTYPQLVNTYGPTEATVVATMHKLPSSAPKDTALPEVPIGCPLRHVQAYVLDKYLKLTPVGVPGELHIGGVSLARGYLNRPELTSEKFIPNPFSDETGARLYKTGDLVRYLPDGNIDYLGRIDNQVKIRGFRIELGEIEALLSQHPSVHENVVIAREDEPGNQRLVAYIVSYREPTPATSELRQFLKKQLPDYMLPSAFVMLEALPLTLNGKVDRRALPVPDLTTREAENTFVAPRTPTEEILLGIWADILGVEVGVYDNFFELGGHSLLAMQVISRVRQAFGVELSMRSLFEAPTVAEFAEQIDTLLWATQQNMTDHSINTDDDLEEIEL